MKGFAMYGQGKKVYLAHTKVVFGSHEITVVDTFVVTIINLKTGVLGKFSHEPSSLPSLLARDKNGVLYGKNWTYWPEGTSCDPEIAWTRLNDNYDEEESQIVEICRLYNRYVSCRMGQPNTSLNLIDEFGAEFNLEDCVDLRNVGYCSKHDHWLCPGEDECFGCLAEKQGDEAEISESDVAWGG